MIGLHTKKLMCLGLLVSGFARGASAGEGSNPSLSSLSAAPKDDATAKQLEQLQEQLAKAQEELKGLRRDVGDFPAAQNEFCMNSDQYFDGEWKWPLSRQACYAADLAYKLNRNLEEEVFILQRQVCPQERSLVPANVSPNLHTRVEWTEGWIGDLKAGYEVQQQEREKLESQLAQRTWIGGGLLALFGYKAFKPEITTVYTGAVNSRAAYVAGAGLNKAGLFSTRVVTGIGNYFSKSIPNKAAQTVANFTSSHSQALNIGGAAAGVLLMGHAAYRNYAQPVEDISGGYEIIGTDSGSSFASEVHLEEESQDSASRTVSHTNSGFQLKETLLSKEFITGATLAGVSALNLAGCTDAKNTLLLCGGAALAVKVAVDSRPMVNTAYYYAKSGVSNLFNRSTEQEN